MTNHMWIIYLNQSINYSEFEILGHRDLDHMNHWNIDFVNEETSSRAIHFISEMQKLKQVSTNQHAESCLVDSLGDKQKLHAMLSLSIIEHLLIHYA